MEKELRLVRFMMLPILQLIIRQKARLFLLQCHHQLALANPLVQVYHHRLVHQYHQALAQVCHQVSHRVHLFHRVSARQLARLLVLAYHRVSAQAFHLVYRLVHRLVNLPAPVSVLQSVRLFLRLLVHQ